MREPALFKGASQVSVDAKGRMAMPARHRGVLTKISQGQLVITVDPDNCLLIFPKSVWQEIELQLINLPSLNKQARIAQRIYLGHASECEMDAQGRLLLPTLLRNIAGIKRQATLSGQGRKFELWNSAAWNARVKQWMKKASEEQEVTELLESIRL